MKKWVFLLVFVYMALEVSSFTMYSLVKGRVFSFKEINNTRQAVTTDTQQVGDLRVDGVRVPWNVSIHPYFGFGKPSGLYFLENKNDVAQSDPDGIVVAITGGSVSQNVFRDSGNIVKEYVERVPAFKDKNIHVISIGHFAWKQPQQLTALAYYLSMGGRLDILINLDGHNEVVDAGANIMRGVFPAYPFLWYQLASNVLTVDRMNLIGDINYLRKVRFYCAKVFAPLRFNITMNVTWDLIDNYVSLRIDRKRADLEETADKDMKERPYYKYGPHRKFESPREAYEYFAQVWMNASIQMDRLAKSSGASYFHFLQPNQYVPDSKTFSSEEREKYYKPKHVGAGVRAGYPLLLNAAETLKRNGVEFHDLTMIFKNEPGTIYKDVHCHTNKKGRDMMADAIGRIVFEHYER